MGSAGRARVRSEDAVCRGVTRSQEQGTGRTGTNLGAECGTLRKRARIARTLPKDAAIIRAVLPFSFSWCKLTGLQAPRHAILKTPTSKLALCASPPCCRRTVMICHLSQQLLSFGRHDICGGENRGENRGLRAGGSQARNRRQSSHSTHFQEPFRYFYPSGNRST